MRIVVGTALATITGIETRLLITAIGLTRLITSLALLTGTRLITTAVLTGLITSLALLETGIGLIATLTLLLITRTRLITTVVLTGLITSLALLIARIGLITVLVGLTRLITSLTLLIAGIGLIISIAGLARLISSLAGSTRLIRPCLTRGVAAVCRTTDARAQHATISTHLPLACAVFTIGRTITLTVLSF